ncbi:unnamed protein product [Effrenium voratum]|nr:unnamed protein product [Effrenium voratum]
MLVLCCNLGFPFLPKDCVGCQSLQHQEPLFVRPDSQEAVEAGREGLTSNDPTEFLDCQAWMADQLQHLFSQPIDWLDQGAQLHEVALYIVSTKGVALPYGWPADFM